MEVIPDLQKRFMALVENTEQTHLKSFADWLSVKLAEYKVYGTFTISQYKLLCDGCGKFLLDKIPSKFDHQPTDDYTIAPKGGHSSQEHGGRNCFRGISRSDNNIQASFQSSSDEDMKGGILSYNLPEDKTSISNLEASADVYNDRNEYYGHTVVESKSNSFSGLKTFAMNQHRYQCSERHTQGFRFPTSEITCSTNNNGYHSSSSSVQNSEELQSDGFGFQNSDSSLKAAINQQPNFINNDFCPNLISTQSNVQKKPQQVCHIQPSCDEIKKSSPATVDTSKNNLGTAYHSGITLDDPPTSQNKSSPKRFCGFQSIAQEIIDSGPVIDAASECISSRHCLETHPDFQRFQTEGSIERSDPKFDATINGFQSEDAIRKSDGNSINQARTDNHVSSDFSTWKSVHSEEHFSNRSQWNSEGPTLSESSQYLRKRKPPKLIHLGDEEMIQDLIQEASAELKVDDDRLLSYHGETPKLAGKQAKIQTKSAFHDDSIVSNLLKFDNNQLTETHTFAGVNQNGISHHPGKGASSLNNPDIDFGLDLSCKVHIIEPNLYDLYTDSFEEGFASKKITMGLKLKNKVRNQAYRCKLCGKVLLNCAGYNRHIKTHNKIICEKCGSQFEERDKKAHKC